MAKEAKESLKKLDNGMDEVLNMFNGDELDELQGQNNALRQELSESNKQKEAYKKLFTDLESRTLKQKELMLQHVSKVNKLCEK
jgi:hypothetical protein